MPQRKPRSEGHSGSKPPSSRQLDQLLPMLLGVPRDEIAAATRATRPTKRPAAAAKRRKAGR
jgi:hypothetical protein